MSHISDNLIETIQQAVRPQLIEVDGEQFTSQPVYPLPQPYTFKDPAPEPLRFRSLTALVDYVNGPFTVEAQDVNYFLHVHGPTSVTLDAHLSGAAEQRDRYATAQYEEGTTFKFGDFVPSELFIIQVQAQFVDTEHRAALLRLVGNIKDSIVKQVADDGVTQGVTAKVGIVRAEDVPVPNPVWLSPRRTFTEIEQPASPFVVRLRSREPLPECALFEADGAAWKNIARGEIKEWLHDRLPGVTILA